MLLYVLPFVILLIVAIILKKREANSQKAEPNKKSVSGKNKSKLTSKKTTVVENVADSSSRTATTTATSTTLAPELRRHIEKQIRDGNYFAAEAQINQALNRDKSQHELYLLLLNLHLLQNDEFAVNQLFTHLRALQLPDILAQAEQTRQKFEADHAAEVQAKVDAKAAQLAANSISFDQLQEQITTPKAEVAPLEFNTSTTETQSVESSPQTTPSVQVATPSEPASLDFAFSTEPTKAEPASPAQTEVTAPVLDFGFTGNSNPVAAQVETVSSVESVPKPSLDFNLEQPIPTQKPELEFNIEQTTPTTTNSALEFKLDLPNEPQFNLDERAVEPTATQLEPDHTATEAKTQPEFEFKLDLATTSELQTEPKTKFEFSLDQFNEAEVASPTVTPATNIVAPITAAPSPTETETDPLLQLFPDLQHTDELSLNLALAEQYISLGAYAEARSLLAENNDAYNDTQREIAAQLLNKIAS